MSDAAMNAAVSALQAESSALSVISQNLANSSTTGYKADSTNFQDLLTSQDSANYYGGGGVVSHATQAVDVQGLIETTETSTNMAVDGKGLFVVSNGVDGTSDYYTRNGTFTTDSDGYLQLSDTNYYLMGWPTDADGTVSTPQTSSALQAINIDKYESTASATSTYSLEANLPAEAQDDPSEYSSGFSTSLTVYDSLGVEQTVPVTFTPEGDDPRTMTVGNPTDSGGDTQTGTLSTSSSDDAYSFSVTFNSDGSLSSITGITDGDGFTPPTDANGNAQIDVSSWTDGASASTITLNLGTSGSTNGLSQEASGDSTPEINIENTSQDGYAYGQLSSVKVDSDGTVVAEYNNGQSVDIYKVPLASFPDDSGLGAMSDGVYEQTSDSGDPTYNIAGTNGTGTVEGGSLEESTVDTATEFSDMVVAQQAYQAASQVIGVDKQNFTSLIDVMQ